MWLCFAGFSFAASRAVRYLGWVNNAVATVVLPKGGLMLLAEMLWHLCRLSYRNGLSVPLRAIPGKEKARCHLGQPGCIR